MTDEINVFKLSNLAEMTDEEIDAFASAIWDSLPKDELTKHLAGKHDQSTHGHGHGGPEKIGHADLSKFDGIVKDSHEFTTTMESLNDYSYYPFDDEDIGEGLMRASFRNQSMEDPIFFAGFDALQDSASKYIQDNPISVLVNTDALANIVGEGGFQTLFDDPETKGEYYYKQRSMYEKAAFDYDEGKTDPDMRPVYGAVFDKDIHATDAQTMLYGNVQVVLKDSVKSRATFTVGDSLDTWQKPTPLGGKFARCYDNANVGNSVVRFNRQPENKGKNYFSSYNFQTSNYIEAQVHDGVKLDDIEKVIFHNGSEKQKAYGALSITDILQEYNIPWERNQ